MLYADLYQRQQLHMWCLWLPSHEGRGVWVVFRTTDSSRMQTSNSWWLRLYFEIFCQTTLINPLIMSEYYVAVVFGVSYLEGSDVWFLLHCWQNCAEALKWNQNEMNITVDKTQFRKTLNVFFFLAGYHQEIGGAVKETFSLFILRFVLEQGCISVKPHFNHKCGCSLF